MARDEESGGSEVVTVLLVILIIVLIGALLFVLNRAGITLPFWEEARKEPIERYLDDYNYQGAYTVYSAAEDKAKQEEIVKAHLEKYFDACFSEDYSDEVWKAYRGIEVFENTIKDNVFQRLDTTVISYYNNEFSKDDAKKYLSRIGKFSFCKERLTDLSKEVEYKEISDTAYRQGVDLFVQGDYENSVKELKKVSPMDKALYANAQTGIEQCRDIWGSEKLAEAKGLLDAKNTQAAQTLLEDLIELFGEYEEATVLLEGIAAPSEA